MTMVPDWKFASRIAILAITVPATALLAYLLFFRNDDEEEDLGQKVETSRQTVIRLTVPNKAVGAVIGQQGAVIKKIQEESGAKVHFVDREQQSTGNEDREILIRGTTVSAQKAEVMILKIIADRPKIVTEEIEVPGYCIGRIIGKGGERIREMSRTSQCKIFVDRTQDARALHLLRTITITGPQDRVDLAKTLLAERVEEEEASRVKMAVGTANRGQRKQERRPNEDGIEKSERSVTVTLASRVVDENEMWGAGDSRTVKIATANPVKEFMEIFVSACEHPGHFWVQMVSSASLQLDQLTDDMTAFYSNSSNEEFRVKDIKVGDVIAAPFSDNLWYRAEVTGLHGDHADLYFMDYGDSLFLPIDSLRELRPQYLSLPVQSVECKLANVRPTGEQWTEEAVVCFESLTHCAAWKVLSAQTVGYENSKFGPVPCLEIVQPASDDQAIDVAAELVARGFAVWDTKLLSFDDDSNPKPASDAMETVTSDPVP